MKGIIKFKNGVFKQTTTSLYGPHHELSDSKGRLVSLMHDLEIIKNNFGDYYSREVILNHQTPLPPKSKRCVLEILGMHETITHSTNRFKDYDGGNARLEVVLNFKKEHMDFIVIMLDHTLP